MSLLIILNSSTKWGFNVGKNDGKFVSLYQRDVNIPKLKIDMLIKKGNFGKPKVPYKTHQILIRPPKSRNSKTISLWNNDNTSFAVIFELLKCICDFRKEEFFISFVPHSIKLGDGRLGFTHYIILSEWDKKLKKPIKSRSFGVDLGGVGCDIIASIIERELKKKK